MPAPLSTPKVYHELLGAIESPLQSLCQLEFTAEQLAATLDQAGPHDVLACLDMRAASGEGGAGAAADAAAA
jgi:hypothetical protein